MLTPLDIQNQSFNKALRGYDPEEVRAFLRQAAQEWARLLEEKRDLQRKIEAFSQEIARYKEMESLLQRTLLQAEESSRALIDNAEKKAQLILEEAHQKAASELAALQKEKQQLEESIRQLRERRLDILLELRSFLQMQLERLEPLAQESPKAPPVPSTPLPPEKLAPSRPEVTPWASKLAEKL